MHDGLAASDDAGLCPLPLVAPAVVKAARRSRVAGVRDLLWACCCGLALSCGGCASYYRFTNASGVAGSAIPPQSRSSCDLVMRNTTPGDDYEEIGTLDVKTVVVPDSADWFIESVKSQVCDLGGSLLVPQVNWRGQYLRGIVYRRAGSLAK